MDWTGLIKCVVLIFVVLAVYLVLMNTKWKDRFNEYPFLPLGIIMIVLVIVGIIARVVML